MSIRLSLAALIFCSAPAAADTVLAARTIRSQTIVTAADLLQTEATTPGTYGDPSQVIGMETRVALYAGRPIRSGDVGPAAVIDRNQVVTIIYTQNTLVISAEGRALDRVAPGEPVRVMNLSSRTTITGRAQADGSVKIISQ